VSHPNRPPTIADVADLAGVSSATVSYVLSGRRNGEARISDRTRQRVLGAASTLGYAPNQSARSLRRKRTDRVVLVTSLLYIPYNEIFIQQFDQAAEAHGYMTVILVGGTAERDCRAFEQLRQGLADGAYIDAGMLHSSVMNEAALAQLTQAGLAVVVSETECALPGVDIVRRMPEAQAAGEAVRHLVARGHSHIGYLGYGPLDPPSPRYAACLQVLAEHGLAVDGCACAVHQQGMREDAYRCAVQLLCHANRPSAIFADTDLAAIAAIWAARDAGLAIPGDIAIIGLGNLPDGQLTRPALTTVGPPRIDFGPGIEMLFDRLAGRAPAAGRRWEMSWQLITRGSV
jgi:DNA-binding LacI/PurR family transcriptional regulator